jgi:hypothetical protein
MENRERIRRHEHRSRLPKINNDNQATSKEANIYTTPAAQVKFLLTNTGEPVMIYEFRLLVVKIMDFKNQIGIRAK